MKESNKSLHLNISKKNYRKNIMFSKIKLYPYSIPMYKLEEIDISTTINGINIDIPFYINAMTGGIKESVEINKRLFNIAKKLNLLMFTGSYSKGLKGEYINSYLIKEFKENNMKFGLNIGIDKGIDIIKKINKEISPTFMQVHINTMQEYLQNISNKLDYMDTFKRLHEIDNLILKEVGFGMSKEFLNLCIKNGINTVDISGKGGTNFAEIENEITENKEKFYLNDWGITTLDSLIESKDINILKLASGGINNPLDIVKCLILGADAVGMSSKFIYLLSNYTDSEIIEILKGYIEDIKVIMSLLGAKNIKELRNIRWTLDEV